MHNPIAARTHVENAKKSMRENRGKTTQILKKIKNREWNIKGVCSSRRGYRFYNHAFGKFLADFTGGKNRDIASFLTEMRESPEETIRILDEGGGSGRFGAALKKILTSKGVKSEITILDLRKSRELLRHKKRKKIDRIIFGPAELYLPKKPYHTIFSLYGGTSYAPYYVRKSTLLKYCHSLKKGGVFFLGLRGPLDGISNNLDSIEKELRAGGFKQMLYQIEPEANVRDFPRAVLIIQRKK
jgi:hypothetical protein